MIVVDFTGGKEMYTEIGPQLTGLDIGVLGECVHVCVRACVCVCASCTSDQLARGSEGQVTW